MGIRKSKEMNKLLVLLFGENSKKAKDDELSDRDYVKLLISILGEIKLYIKHNINTSQFHQRCIEQFICITENSLTEALEDKSILADKSYWNSYSASITALCLLLIGDIPSHRNYTRGKKSNHFYKLNRFQTVNYNMNKDQVFNTLLIGGGFIHKNENRGRGDNYSKTVRNAYDQYVINNQPVNNDSKYNFIDWYKFNDDYFSVKYNELI